MSPLDLAFLVGPLVAPLIGILVMVALVVARPTEWALWIGSQLFGLTAAASLTYWFLWGRAFDRVHTELDPSASSEVAINAAIWACAAGCMALVVTAVSAFVSTRRPRAHVHILRHRRPCVTQLIRNEAGRRGGPRRGSVAAVFRSAWDVIHAATESGRHPDVWSLRQPARPRRDPRDAGPGAFGDALQQRAFCSML